MLFLLSLVVHALAGLLAGRRADSSAQELEILVAFDIGGQMVFKIEYGGLGGD